EVPVGRDQIQHVEMARDIAGRFNHRFKEVFTLPEVKIDENVELLVGLDGRKMSKSYGNTIPLWENDKKTQKSVNKIITNMKEPGEPKQPDESPLFEIYKAFSTSSETAAFTQMLAEGLAWGEAKKLLAAKINAELAEPRERYNELTANPSQIEDILQAGAAKARKEARELLDKVRDAVGIRPLK
ncbi:MAG: tryptophan--tRNA ligase, partial [Neisseria sicca]|nr:tryptophan--tRNA ligase [Neisseria sicca]